MPVLTSSIINSAEIKDKIYYIWDDMVKGFALKVKKLPLNKVGIFLICPKLLCSLLTLLL